MTSFCSQCGNPVRAGGKFCQSCGAPSIQTTPQSSQPSPSGTHSGQGVGGSYSSGYPSSSPSSYQVGQAGYPGSFPAQQAPPAQGQGSGRTLKVILITLLVIGLLIGGSVLAVTYVLRRAVNNIVQVSDGKDGQPAETVLNIPGGPRISTGGGVTEEQLGVPIYPGATPLKDQGSVSISGSNAGGQGWFGAATFTTDDSLDEVVAFYRDNLGDEANRIESKQEGRQSTVFTLQSPKGWRMVTIEKEDGEAKTKIAIASVTGSSAQ